MEHDVHGAHSGGIIPSLSFRFPFQWGSALEKKTFLLKNQVLSFKRRPHLGSIFLSRETDGKPQKLFPFVKNYWKNLRALD